MFNHTIELKLEDRITIIHGPNGYGKTVLLNMIFNLFNRNYGALYEIPFEEFRVDLENGSYIICHKSSEIKQFIQKSPFDHSSDHDQPPANNTKVVITACKFGGHEERFTFTPYYEPEPEILREILNSVNIRFIETQRLLNASAEKSTLEEKLNTYNASADRVDLFKELINSRFSYKKLIVSKQDGFKLETYDNKLLNPINLSSGEKHELFLLYELLFEVESGSLILIDEPEIFLHIGWQGEFLGDLEKITKISSFDVLITTHSPQLVSDRWDLTVELKGKQ